MKKVLGMGNALVDILMKLKSDSLLEKLCLPKGSMQLIDETTMRKIENETFLLDHHVATGGSASNTISGLARMGVPVGLIGKVGNDTIGEFFRVDSFDNGVQPHLFTSSNTPSGCCHVLISPDSERTMCTYLGAASRLRAEELTSGMFEHYDILHIEGYLIINSELITQAAKLAKEAGMKISIDLASYNVVEANLEFLREYVQDYVDIVFANEEEAYAFTGKKDAKAAAEIAKMCDIAVVKVGSRGSIIQCGEVVHTIPAHPVESIDTTGAGDLYAAGFLYGYATDLSLNRCAEIGTLCASLVIQRMGAKLDDKGWSQILKFIA